MKKITFLSSLIGVLFLAGCGSQIKSTSMPLRQDSNDGPSLQKNEKEMNCFQGNFSPASLSVMAGSIKNSKASFTLEIETVCKFEKVEVVVSIPKGFKLISGENYILIDNFNPGEKKILNFEVQVEDKRERYIIAVVKAINLIDESYSRDFIMTVNPSYSLE
ncbi:MAG: hypothetical protein ABIC82_01610 [bacterium]